MLAMTSRTSFEETIARRLMTVLLRSDRADALVPSVRELAEELRRLQKMHGYSQPWIGRVFRWWSTNFVRRQQLPSPATEGGDIFVWFVKVEGIMELEIAERRQKSRTYG